MRTLKVLVPLAVLIGLLGLVTSGSGSADADNAPTWQHAAKFVCGTSQATTDAEDPVLVGVYATVINVHNPNFATVKGSGEGPSPSSSFSPTFRKKALVLFGDVSSEPRLPEAPREPAQWWRPPDLLSDWGFEIDCSDIRAVLIGGTHESFIEGYVVIEAKSKLPLDVTAVYTHREANQIGGTAAGTVVTSDEDVETVQPKKIRSGSTSS